VDFFRTILILAASATAIAIAGYAQAQPRPLNLTSHLPPGEDACFGRVYDAKHLAAHPKQRVTSFHLFRDFSADTNAEEAPILTEKDRATDDPINVGLMAYVRFRDRPGVFSNWLVCYRQTDGGVRCGVECDGGGFKLRTSGSALIAENEGFVVSGGCRASGDQEDEQEYVRQGADDRVFRLDKLPLAA
jgi:hypothetical protein